MHLAAKMSAINEPTIEIIGQACPELLSVLNQLIIIYILYKICLQCLAMSM